MKNKINIVWIHSHFLYWMGGTKFVYQVLKEIEKSERILSTYAIVEKSSEFSKKKIEESKINFVSLKSITSTNPFYWIFLPFFIFLDIYKIKNFFIKNKLDSCNTIIISGMFPMNVVSYFLKMKHIQNCYEPFAFFYDNQFISQFSLPKRIFIKYLSLIYSPLDKWATKKSNLILTLNNTTQKMIRKVYSLDSIKTQAGVNSQLFKPYVSSKIRKKYQINKVAVHSTDYSPVKGTDLVIKAFAKASKNIPEAKLLITSTIKNKEREFVLKSLAKELKIADKINFLGFVSIEELPQYYSLANVMVQGAFSENSGTTSMSLPVKEAMCCETPAIRPNAGGEDVDDEKTGFLVDPRNIEALAEKIRILLLDKKLSKKMGKKARIFIKNKYTWKNTANIFIRNCY